MVETTRVTITKGHRVYFEGCDRVEGDTISVPTTEANLLIALGRAVAATNQRPLRVADPQPVRRAPDAEQASFIGEGEATQRRGRRYRRTDMQSED